MKEISFTLFRPVILSYSPLLRYPRVAVLGWYNAVQAYQKIKRQESG